MGAYDALFKLLLLAKKGLSGGVLFESQKGPIARGLARIYR